MNNNLRIIISGITGVILFTFPLFIITPLTALLIAAYCTSILAIILLCTTMYIGINRTSGMFVTTTALMLIVWRYVLINIFFSGVILYFHISGKWHMPLLWFLFSHLAIIAVSVWKMLAADAGREEIEKLENSVKRTIFTWKSLQIKTAAIVTQTNGVLKKEAELIHDAIRYADPVTLPQLADIENAICTNVDLFSKAIEQNDTEKCKILSEEIIQQVNHRSEMCKFLK